MIHPLFFHKRMQNFNDIHGKFIPISSLSDQLARRNRPELSSYTVTPSYTVYKLLGPT